MQCNNKNTEYTNLKSGINPVSGGISFIHPYAEHSTEKKPELVRFPFADIIFGSVSTKQAKTTDVGVETFCSVPVSDRSLFDAICRELQL